MSPRRGGAPAGLAAVALGALAVVAMPAQAAPGAPAHAGVGAAGVARGVAAAAAPLAPALEARLSTQAAAHAGARSPSQLPGAPTTPATLPLRVSVDRLTPAVPEPGDELVVEGTIANAAADAVDAVQVRMRLADTPVAARADLAAIVDGSAPVTGARVPGTREPVSDRLAPGASAPFRITVPVDEMGLGRAGVYDVTIEAVGDDGSGSSTRLGVARTLLPWVPRPDSVSPSRLVTLWPLTAAPAVDSEGVLLNETLARDVAVGGRLRTALDVGARAGSTVSWVVDPALLETVADMSDGYRVRTPGGDVVPGENPAPAAAWLTATRSALAAADVLALPYADPDAVALVRGRLDRDVLRAVTSSAPATGILLGRTVDGALAWPPGRAVDEATLAVLHDAGARGVLLDERSLPVEPATSFTPTGSAAVATPSGGLTRAVVADTGMSAAFTMPGSSAAEVVLARQRLAAELTMAALELPDTPRTFVAAPPTRWNPSPGLANALVGVTRDLPWITPTALSGLLAAPPSDVPRGKLRYDAAARAAELPPSFVSRLAASERGLRALGEVAVDPEELVAGPAGALARCGSSAWRADSGTGTRLLGLTAATIGGDVGRIQIISRGTVSLPRESGVVPVTVANQLDVAVVVGLRLTGDPAIRVSADPVPPFTVGPGRKASVDVRVRVSGSGTVPVTLQLTTAAGTPFGVPAQMEVGSTASAQAAGWVVGGAFLLLLALVAVNTVRRIRVARARRHGHLDDDEPPDPAGPGEGSVRLLRDQGAAAGQGPDPDGSMRL